MTTALGNKTQIRSKPEYRFELIKTARKDHEDKGLFDNNPSPFTPEYIVEEMVKRVKKCKGLDIRDKNIRVLVLFTLEMAVQLMAESCDAKNITIATLKECRATKKIAMSMGCNYMTLPGNERDWKEISMKFDVVMGNPPYQNKEEGNRKSQTIWPDFVEIGCRFLKSGDGGGGRYPCNDSSAWMEGNREVI